MATGRSRLISARSRFSRPRLGRRIRRLLPVLALLLAVGLDAHPAARAQYSATAVVRSATGADPASIQAAVDSFRADLGDPANAPGPAQPSGRREINWDGVPDSVAAPNQLPPDFFNTKSPRGVVFTTPGSGFEVSANDGAGPVRFGDINPTYSGIFQTFSPQRLFTPLDSTITDVTFFLSGTATPAAVSGFGAVFSNVRLADTTTIEYFDASGASLGRFSVPAGPAGGLSFLGVSFPSDTRVGRVRISSGSAPLAAATYDGDDVNLVVMDDFIYGEPQ